MVDHLGRWTAEQNYSTYPKEKWCDMDHVANYISGQGYEPKTSIENLVVMVILHFDREIEDDSVYLENGMINIPNLSALVEESGGLRAFDYWA
jgi:hypothetical protein